VKQLLARARSSTLARNSIWMFAGQGASIAVQAVYFMVIARLLSSSQYGLFVGASALVTMIGQYSTLGAGVVLLRNVSADRSRFPEYFGNILLTLLPLGSLLVLVVHFSATWMMGPGSVRMLTVLAVSEFLFGQMIVCMSQVFQAFERMRITATLNLSANVLRLAIALVLMARGERLSAEQWSYVTLALTCIAASIAVLTVLRRFGRPVFRPRLVLTHAGEGLTYSLSGTATTASNDIDKTMLVHYGMSAQSGVYAMAYRVVDVCHMPIRSIHGAAFPRFFQLGRGDGIEGSAGFARRLLRKTVLLGLAGCIGMFLAAPVIPHLVGASFSQSISALRWLCLIPLFRCFHLSAGDALVGAGYQRLRLIVQGIMAAANVALNIYLIPHYGWRGAAWSSLGTDGGMAILMWGLLQYVRATANAGGNWADIRIPFGGFRRNKRDGLEDYA
jgi:O-antigen/teichoic acid export membrane protein